jgi:hypothetical protein
MTGDTLLLHTLIFASRTMSRGGAGGNEQGIKYRTGLMKKLPERNPQQDGTSEGKQVAGMLVKRGLEDAIPFFGGLLADLVEARKQRLQEAIRKNNDERLQSFYEELLSGDVPLDPEVADKMLDSRDYHALLRACLADVESEKVRSYAQLAKSVASRRVDAEWVRHFILSLSAISIEELTRLQKAYVAGNYPLMPDRGPSVQESFFLQPEAPGSLASIVIANLTSRGFIHDGKLSSTGTAFVKACMPERDLSPGAIGYKTWSEHNIAILNYEIGNAMLDGLAGALEQEFRTLRMKSSILALNRNNAPTVRMTYTHAILLVGSAGQHILNNVEHLQKLGDRMPIVVVNLKDHISLPGVTARHTLSVSGRDDRAVVNDVRDVLLATIRGS